jgi:site-specific DNA-methyltransferase (adenine-specific)
MISINHCDNLAFLQFHYENSIDMIYIDPPFNTGKVQSRTSISTVRDAEGDRTGFGGQRYATLDLGTTSYVDTFDDYLGFIEPRLREAHRVLKPNGSFFFHIDPRESHYCKVLLDKLFGRENFRSEIIWAFDYGARSKKVWPAKHNTIFWYTKGKDYTFNLDECDRIAYMAPDLVGPEKAAKGKTPTDVWWHTIVPTNGKEKTGYATQKPLGLIERIVKVHSNPGDVCMDFFAGSGTFGEACAKNGRSCILVDENPQAIDVMAKRLEKYL